MSKWFSMRGLVGGLGVLLLPAAAFGEPHVRETLTLTEGWNAVYIESTPVARTCDEFFRDTPVAAAAAYRSDADAATAQYDAEGREIVQAPVEFLTWVRGEPVSTLQGIVGGKAFLLYATNAATLSFDGVPCAPRMTWRKVLASETNEFFNLAGVSSGSAEVSIQGYFGEGPFGLSKTGRAIYSIGGTDTEEGPDLVNAEKGGFGRPPTIAAGKAYALTAARAGEWPGVVGVEGEAVAFGGGAPYASVKVRNCGTKAREFGFSVERSSTGEELPPLSRRLPRTDALDGAAFEEVAESAAWTVALEPDAVAEQVFCLDRSRLEEGKEYGAILVVEDLGGSKMRVRLPIAVEAAPSDAAAYPVGLWVGQIALTRVSGLYDAVPALAGGRLEMDVMLHVAADGKCTLLQRVAAGYGEDGEPRLFRELDGVPPEVAHPSRFSTVMMSVDTPAVVAAAGAAFGDAAEFSWTVGEKARDNPFRHAWHPDHDGKTADYSGDAPSGDDFSNYADPVKPELWSIGNRLVLSWHEQGDPSKPVVFPYNADETTSGVVTWEVTGLLAKGPVKSVGTFSLRRVFKAGELE
ncbi:MAG: hypothetical protein IKQ55_02935 [Kiritimatiellae bacterium]|nr:hypothetical protein [Kiritimatiellia bacterium]